MIAHPLVAVCVRRDYQLSGGDRRIKPAAGTEHDEFTAGINIAYFLGERRRDRRADGRSHNADIRAADAVDRKIAGDAPDALGFKQLDHPVVGERSSAKS